MTRPKDRRLSVELADISNLDRDDEVFARDDRLAFRLLAAALLALQIGHAWAGGPGAEPATRDVGTAPVRTVKERLSSKASDEQRVDNCKVPPELRGSKPRPDDCGHAPAGSRSAQ